MKYELIIIGAGVWGTSAALAAVRSGLTSVLLVETNPGVASESSAKAGGIVTDLVWHPEDVDWVQRSRQLYQEAYERTRDRSILQRYGMLTLAEPSRRDLLHRRAKGLQQRGIVADLWEISKIYREFPELDRLNPETLGLWTPGDFHVNPTAYAESVVVEARNQGLSLRLGTRVDRLVQNSASVSVQMGSESLQAERILVTAGTWSAKLLGKSGFHLPMRPYRVQLSSLDFPQGYHLPMVWELKTDVYLVPDGPHNLLAGDGTRLFEHDPDDYQTTGDEEFESNIAAQVINLTSQADTAGLRTSWAGLAGSTPDRRPLVGQVAERLFVACGDQGFGVMRGPALGELGLKVALGEADAPHLSPLRHPGGDFPIRPGFTLEEEL
ncbi:MAG: FAD-binding oxidoreductase [Firmicutes bacterium]|nr:FAD-binding oxidoreductase [Bacillota bacterium]